MDFTVEHQPEISGDHDLAPDRAAPNDAESRVLWQELRSYGGVDEDRDDSELSSEPIGAEEHRSDSRVAARAGTLTLAPVMVRERGEDGQRSGAGATHSGAADNAGDLRPVVGDSGRPPGGTDGSKETAGDGGQLPKREQIDEKTLPDDQQAELIGVGRAVIDRTTSDDGSRSLSLPGGNRSTYQVREEADGVRVASDWRIDINEQQHDLGIGRRLAKATADDLIRKDIDQLDVTVDSEATLRTMLSVFDGSIEYIDTTSPIETPQQALAELERRASEDGDSFVGLSARVNVQDFVNRHLEYQTGPDERVFDRCDFSKIHAGPEGMYGEVDQMRQRILALPEPHATNATLAFNELLANYNAHVLPHNPGERYEVRLSWVRDPDTFKSHIRLTNYFFGEVGPGVVEDINLHLLDREEVFYGESREASGAEVDPEDVEAAHELEEKGDEVTARLQQTGRGLATIARVSSRAIVVRFPAEQGGGGGFIIDLKDVEVAAAVAGPAERPTGPSDEDDVDALIDNFLSDFNEDEI